MNFEDLPDDAKKLYQMATPSEQKELLTLFEKAQGYADNVVQLRPSRGDSEPISDLQLHRGVPGSAILDAPEVVESVWGDGHRSMWAKGEPFLICGPDGVGKTTLAQQLVLYLAGVKFGKFLGLPVTQSERVLYLACDRPTQALRSFRRMVDESDRPALDEHLTIWKGPLPFDVSDHPEGVLELANVFKADVVVIDSLKDIAADLSKEETGLGLNNAFQIAVAEGVEVVALHHQRKAQSGGGKPNHISDVYGSRWITAGMGSVVMLWGEAGDLVVDFSQLKQPDEQIGPWKITHDHGRGTSTVVDFVDAWSVVKDATRGVTAQGAAILMFKDSDPDQNKVAKARRQLDRLANEGKIHKEGGAKGGRPGENAAVYFPISSRGES